MEKYITEGTGVTSIFHSLYNRCLGTEVTLQGTPRCLGDRLRFLFTSELIRYHYYTLWGDQYKFGDDLKIVGNFDIIRSPMKYFPEAVRSVKRIATTIGFFDIAYHHLPLRFAIMHANLAARYLFDEISKRSSSADLEEGMERFDKFLLSRTRAVSFVGVLFTRIGKMVKLNSRYGVYKENKGTSIGDILQRYSCEDRIEILLKIYVIVSIRLCDIRGENRVTDTGIIFSGVEGRVISSRDLVTEFTPEIRGPLLMGAREIASILVDMRRDRKLFTREDLSRMKRNIVVHLAWLQAQTQTEMVSID